MQSMGEEKYFVKKKKSSAITVGKVLIVKIKEVESTKIVVRLGCVLLTIMLSHQFVKET